MTETSSTRVVVTGMGWITPLGHDIESAWAQLLAGTSAICPIESFDASTFPTSFAAQVKDYDFTKYVKDTSCHERIRKNSAFALGAASQAWQMSGLGDYDALNPYRVGLYLGCGEGELDFDTYAQACVDYWSPENRAVNKSTWAKESVARFHPTTEIEQDCNMPLAHLSMEFGIQGPAYNCLTACAASTQAIGEATDMIRTGRVDVMMAGGSHTMIHPFGVTGFNRLTALSNRNDDPASASRPFDRTRDGFVLGEGSGMLILESLEHAQARGATILGEIIGFGSSADAFRITDMHPESRGAIAAIREALDQAGIPLDAIDYISAHGTGTKENDSTETYAIKQVFGEQSSNTPVSSIKSMMGHLIAAAGAVEFITCLLAIRDGKVPPTINLHQPDPACDLDYVPNEARDHQVKIAMSNSFGFGGQNDTLIVKAYEG